VVKIATFAKPEPVTSKAKRPHYPTLEKANEKLSTACLFDSRSLTFRKNYPERQSFRLADNGTENQSPPSTRYFLPNVK
jgi:hypothetical protein